MPHDISNSTASGAPVTPRQHQQQPDQQLPAGASGAATSAETGGGGGGSSQTQRQQQKTVAEYLAAYPHLTELDRQILALPSDAYFTPHSWANLHQLIGANDLHLLTRSPSQTRAYLDWTSGVRARYGSITKYLLEERLQWTPLEQEEEQGREGGVPPRFAFRNATPFADPQDFLVLRNDWPYGLDRGIVHICVWLKTPLAIQDTDGDLTPEARRLVETFVTETFRKPLREGERGERVLWFKNWTALQSVRGVDHVHVLVRDAPLELLKLWTR